MSEKLKKSEFAARIGRSPSYVTKLAHEGRLVIEGGKVLVADSMARMAATEGGRPDVAARHAQARAEHKPAPADPVDIGMSLTKAKAITETYRAKQAKLDYEASIGKLVPRDDVEAALKFVGAAFATLLDNLPAQHAAVLAPIATPEAMEDALSDLCDTLRHQFGDAISRQQASLAERKKP